MPAEIVVSGNKDLVKREEPSHLDIIRELATNPNVDVEKFERLLAMQERMDAKAAEIAYNQAFAKMQPQLPRIKKNGSIDLGKGKPLSFARYEDIDFAIRPILTQEGFTLSFTSEPTAMGVLMTATLAHSQGHSRTSKMQLPPDAGPGRNALQAIGSSHSYGKRYLTAGLLNLVMESGDDDGHTAFGFITEQQADSILDLLAACGAEAKPELKSKFLSWLKAKAVSEIRKADYQRAVSFLEQKARGV